MRPGGHFATIACDGIGPECCGFPISRPRKYLLLANVRSGITSVGARVGEWLARTRTLLSPPRMPSYDVLLDTTDRVDECEGSYKLR